MADFARRSGWRAVLLLSMLTLAVAGLSTRTSLEAAGSCSVSRTSLTPDSEEADLVARINTYRAQSSLGALAVSPALMSAAAWKSNDMGANRYFAHDDQGRSWSQRIGDCGYAGTPNIAENLAAGNADGASTFEQWRVSAGHNANMLNTSMKAIGVARAYTTGSPYGWYWTADFGAAIDGQQPAVPSSARSSVSAATPSGNAGGSASAGPNSGLSLEATAVVTGTGDCLRVHAVPDVTSSVQGCLPDGSAMVIIAGPASAGGFTWWQLGALGWAVDQYLTPVAVNAGQ